MVPVPYRMERWMTGLSLGQSGSAFICFQGQCQTNPRGYRHLSLSHNPPCKGNETPQILLRQNTSRLITKPQWSSRSRQRVLGISNSSRVRAQFHTLLSRVLTGCIATPEINKAVLDIVLEVHAWASAKPAREHEKTTELLEREVNFIMEKEKVQGRCSVPSRSCTGTRCVVQTHRLIASFCLTSADAPKEQTRATLFKFIKSIKSALAALGETL